MQETLSAALLALDEDFGEIEGYDVVREGSYWVVVEDLAVSLHESSARPIMTWSLRILGPDHFGRRIKRTFVITKTSLRLIKRDLYMCGLGLSSLSDLPHQIENLLNLKLYVRKQGRSVYIVACDGSVLEEGRLFLHLIDAAGREFLDQQLQRAREPRDRKGFQALVGHFVNRYQCPVPHRAYLEDAKTGAVLFSTDPPRTG